MGNFPVRESLCVCPTTPAGLLRDVSQFKPKFDHFGFSQHCKYYVREEINLVFFFSLLFILF